MIDFDIIYKLLLRKIKRLLRIAEIVSPVHLIVQAFDLLQNEKERNWNTERLIN